MSIPVRTSRIVIAFAIMLSLAMSESESGFESIPVAKPAKTVKTVGAPKLLFGAYAPASDENQMGGVGDLESALGTRLDIVLFYQAWAGGGAPFRLDWIETAAAGGRAPLLTWEPWVPGGSASQPDFSLQAILDGRHDDYIRSWAAGVKQFPNLVYLRPMHEMNGNWYPWSGVVNGNSPAKYVAAWRRIHGIFAAAGAKNVRWVWSPYADDVPSTNRFEPYYPGSSYVDLVAIDGYNWGGCEPTYGGWRSFDQLFSGPYSRIMKMGTRKPVWIGEVGTTELGGDKAAWIAGMFTVLKAKYPYVRAVTWFHTVKECDWRATNPAAARIAMAAGLAAR